MYSAETGEFSGRGEAVESPLEPGGFLFPDKTTLVEPPEKEENMTPVWDGEKWILTDDYRGKTYWDTATGEQHKITNLGEKPSLDWTEKEKPDHDSSWNGKEWEISLSTLKERKIRQIQGSADMALMEMRKEYSSAEYESWDRQKSGAKILKKNGDSPHEDARFVRGIAEKRGMPLELFVEKILLRAEEYASKLSTMIGEQKFREDLVKKATSLSELDQI